LSRGRVSHIIDAVSNANDIVDVVSEHVALKRRGKNYVGLCPFHKEKTPSFNVNPERQIFKCFGCGAGGDAIKFVQRILNLTFPEALEQLGRRAGVKVDWPGERGTSGDRGVSKTEIYKVNSWAATFYARCLWDTPEGQSVRNYLSDRGLQEDICRQFSVGYAPAGGRGLLESAAKAGFSPDLLSAAGLVVQYSGTFRDLLHDRVIFPIFDAVGNVVGFGGRARGEAEPKYLNTPETTVFHKSRCLFGLYQGREVIQSSREVVVAEGYTDCIASHQGGLKTVVATLGTALTEEHVHVLRRYAEKIVLIFDGDEAGVRAADRALEVFLTSGVDVKLAELPEGTDPCDLVVKQGSEALEEIISGAADALDYKWSQLERRYAGADSLQSRRRAIDELLRAVAACDPFGRVDAVQRGMVLARLAGMLSVSVEELGRELQRHRRRRSYGGTCGQEKGRAVRGMPVPSSAYEAAVRELLAVLICEPGYIGGIKDLVDPGRFEGEVYRRIGNHLWRAYSELGEFNLRELLSTVEEEDLGDIITELYDEGLSRSNFAETVEEAVRCIQHCRREQQASEIVASMGRELSDEEQDAKLEVLQQNLLVPVRRTPGALID